MQRTTVVIDHHRQAGSADAMRSDVDPWPSLRERRYPCLKFGGLITSLIGNTQSMNITARDRGCSYHRPAARSSLQADLRLWPAGVPSPTP